MGIYLIGMIAFIVGVSVGALAVIGYMFLLTLYKRRKKGGEILDKKTEELIKNNSGVLRQFTALHNEIKSLKGRVEELEKIPAEFLDSFKRKGFEDIPGTEIDKKGDVVLMKAEGTDPD